MKIKIEPQTLITDIKKAFNQQYSQLRIDFFIDHNHDGNFTHDEKVTEFNTPISELATLTPQEASIEVDFSASVTIEQLELVFLSNWGLVAQVFRKRGNSWLMTSHTDHFNLGELQKQSEISQEQTQQNVINAADRRELE